MPATNSSAPTLQGKAARCQPQRSARRATASGRDRVGFDDSAQAEMWTTTRPPRCPAARRRSVRAARSCPGMPSEAVVEACGLDHGAVMEALRRVPPRGRCTEVWVNALAVPDCKRLAAPLALRLGSPPPPVARLASIRRPLGAPGAASWQERIVRDPGAPRATIGGAAVVDFRGKSLATDHPACPAALLMRLAGDSDP